MTILTVVDLPDPLGHESRTDQPAQERMGCGHRKPESGGEQDRQARRQRGRGRENGVRHDLHRHQALPGECGQKATGQHKRRQ